MNGYMIRPLWLIALLTIAISLLANNAVANPTSQPLDQLDQQAKNGTSKPTSAQQLGGDFVLTDHHGKVFDSHQLRGKLSLIFFGYTWCPDVCPTELSAVAQVLKQLDQNSNQLNAVFISIDPQRDTPEKLSKYVPYFSPQMIGLTGSEQQINTVMQRFHVQRKIHRRNPSDKNYLLDHSANLYLLGVDGELLQIIPFGLPAEHILNVVSAELDKLNTTSRKH